MRQRTVMPATIYGAEASHRIVGFDKWDWDIQITGIPLFGQDAGTQPRCYSAAMDEHKAIHLHTSIKAEIRRGIAIAKTNRGNDWQLHSIVNSWGSTMDDRETLQALRTLNQTGSIFATMVGTVH